MAIASASIFRTHFLNGASHCDAIDGALVGEESFCRHKKDRDRGLKAIHLRDCQKIDDPSILQMPLSG